MQYRHFSYPVSTYDVKILRWKSQHIASYFIYYYISRNFESSKRKYILSYLYISQNLRARTYGMGETDMHG